MDVNFCLSCGSTMETRDIDGTFRRACTKCSYVHWGNYSIGVGALVVREKKILLVRRAQNPGKGYWTNPGGYIEQVELIHETIQREVMEESNVEAKVKSVIAVRDQPGTIHNAYIAFSMEYVSGEPRPDDFEVDGAGFFSTQQMESMNVAGFTLWLVNTALQASTSGLIVDDDPVVPLKGYGLFRV